MVTAGADSLPASSCQLLTTREKTLTFSSISKYRWAIVTTAAVGATAVFPLPALVDIAQPAKPVTESLEKSFGYELIAPLSNVLDALTLLSPAQYISTFVLCALVFMAWSSTNRSATVRGLRGWARFLGGTAAVIGIMLVLKRPMASLKLADSDELTVDFHSHTSASHDGRGDFDAEANRSWHSSSGFNVAYVTDHRALDGALVASERNPDIAGNGTVLLPGVELREGDEHPILIGIDPRRMRITSPDWKEAAVKADGGPAPPILFLSLPGNVQRIPQNMTSGTVRVAGVEISDGCPKGIAQSQRDRAAILALAARIGVAVVSGSDNHGWGRTAPAWSVMRIPGWRAMTPAQLDAAIRRGIIDGGPESVRVIGRRTAIGSQGRVGKAFQGFAVGVVMFRTMTLADRLSWAAWAWTLQLSLTGLRRRHRMWRMRAARRVPRRRRLTVRAAA